MSTAGAAISAAAKASAAFRRRMTSLVTLSGGKIEDSLFVTKPGCLLIAKTELAADSKTNRVSELFKTMNIDSSRPAYEQFGEFNSRITYLSFKDKPSSSEKFNHKMARELGHLSVFAPVHATFLLAGIAVETSLELIAHSEARIARLTSSKTAAMSNPLFRIQSKREPEISQQKSYIRSILTARGLLNANGTDWANDTAIEFGNMLLPGSKATALTYTMSIKDFHKMFIGRLNNGGGNETEVQEICGLMCDQLHAHYPLVVRSTTEYAAMNNSDKNKAVPTASPADE